MRKYHGCNNAPLRFCFGRYGLIPQLLRVMRGSAINLLTGGLIWKVFPFWCSHPFSGAQAITGQLEVPQVETVLKGSFLFQSSPRDWLSLSASQPSFFLHRDLLPSLSMSVDPRTVSTKFPACQALSQCLLLRDRGITKYYSIKEDVEYHILICKSPPRPELPKGW